MNTKQVIVIRKDLKMRRGKEIAQGSHASVSFITKVLKDRIKNFRSNPESGISISDFSVGIRLSEAQADWIENDFRKIVCSVDSLEELMALRESAKNAGLDFALITDSGYTEFNGVPTVTALCIGPDYDEKIDPVTSGLKLY